ncbi:MAG: SDR family oxidoreductase [Opitutales bacterium]
MILLLGGSGYVGQAFQDLFARRGIPVRNVRRAEVDYSRQPDLEQLIRETRPDFLINAAGYTGKPNVDACEDDKAACLFGNAVLPGVIAAACGETGLPWGHVSSGCIYNGRRPDGGGWREEDPPNFSFRSPPCSFYSGTKALGEEVLAGEPGVYVWRLRIPFDHREGPRNYLTKLMRYERLLEAENSISHLGEFVEACFACFEKHIAPGTYNVTNPGSVTTREVVDLIRESGVCDKAFAFFDDEAEFMARAARTPRSNCVLDGTKLEQAGITLTPVREAIRRALADWQPET